MASDPPPPPALVTPQRFTLAQDAHNSAWFVVDELLHGHVTGLEAPPEGDCWDIDFDSNGYAWVECDAGSKWLSDVATKRLFRRGDELLVRDRGSSGFETLASAVGMFVEVRIGVRMPTLAAGAVEITAASFTMPSWGYRLWWRAASVYDELGLTMYPGTAASWLAKRKASHLKLCEGLGLGPTAIREALPWKQDAQQSDDGRCLTWLGFSTAALIAVMGSAARRHTRSEGAVANSIDQSTISSFLDSVLLQAPHTWELRLCLDKGFYWIPGKGVSGKYPVVLRVEGGVVDMRPWHAGVSEHYGPADTLHSIGDGSDSLPLAKFVEQACALQCPVGKWLFGQLVCQVGACLDEHFVRLAENTRVGEQSALDGTVWVHFSDVMSGDGRHVASELSRYQKRGLEVFRGCQFLSAAPDASKIGDKGLLISPLLKNETGEAMWAAPQVVRAFVGESELHAKGSEELRDANEAFKESSRQFLKRKAGEPVNVRNPKKVQRLKSFQFVSALDHMLVVHTGSGLEAYQTTKPDGSAIDPHDWRFLSLAADQGSDVKCGINFLTYGAPSLNLEATDDMSHGGWNDIRLMLKDCDQWSHTLLMICAYNTPYGSTLSPSRQDQVLASLQDYLARHGPDDPLFQHFLPFIFEEANLRTARYESDAAQLVWQGLLTDPTLLKKGERVGLCRFMAAIRKAKAEDKLWSRRALLYTILSLQLGYESSKKRAAMFHPSDAPRPAAGSSSDNVADAKPTMKKSDKLLEIKSAGQNQLHMAAMIFGDRDMQLVQRAIVYITDPVIDWHSHQNKFLRCVTNTISWEVCQLGGEVHHPLKEVMARPFTMAPLAKLGIKVSWSPAVLQSMLDRESSYGESVEDKEMCALLVRMACSLTAKRVIRLAPMMLGWPRRFVLLLVDSKRQEVVDQLRQDLANYDMLKERGDDWAQDMVRRSCFNLKSVQQVTLILQQDGWSVSDRLLHIVRQRCSRVIGSQITEDGFNRCKRSLDSGKSNVATEERLWGTMIDKQVLGSIHSFQEINRCSVAPSRGNTCPKEWFHSDIAGAEKRINLKGIMRGGGGGGHP